MVMVRVRVRVRIDYEVYGWTDNGEMGDDQGLNLSLGERLFVWGREGQSLPGSSSEWLAGREWNGVSGS